MSIKAILLDIDGTLENDLREVTPKTKQALLKAQDAGVKLVLASGRTDNGLKLDSSRLELEKHHGILVCFNGALVLDATSREELFSHKLNKDIAKQVLRKIEPYQITPLISKGEYMYTVDVFQNTIFWDGKPFNVLQYESRGNGYKLQEVNNLSDWLNFDVEKIICYGEVDYLKEYSKTIVDQVPEATGLLTAPFYLEFTSKGVDKTKAISTVLEGMNIQREEMIAFGDSQNDRSMLEYAGIGVAMGNAVEEVKAIADEITLSNNENGIAVSLYKHMPELFG